MKKNNLEIKENDLISLVTQYLQILKNQGNLVFVRNNSGAIPIGDKRFIKFGKPGSPDFFIFLKNGQTIHLECKSSKGKLSPKQITYRDDIMKLRHKYYIITYLGELVNILEKAIK